VSRTLLGTTVNRNEDRSDDYLRRLAFWITGLAAVLLAATAFLPKRCCGAPVPQHLFPPPPPPPPPRPVQGEDVKVGFRWYYHSLLLEVVAIDGIYARYICVNKPEIQFSGLDGSDQPNMQCIGRVMAEANGLPFPPPPQFP